MPRNGQSLPSVFEYTNSSPKLTYETFHLLTLILKTLKYHTYTETLNIQNSLQRSTQMRELWKFLFNKPQHHRLHCNISQNKSKCTKYDEDKGNTRQRKSKLERYYKTMSNKGKCVRFTTWDFVWDITISQKIRATFWKTAFEF